MIVSETTKRSNTRWLQVCVLLCAAAVLPVGIASAQDYKAVEKRLGEAVGNGELSLAQADIMMDALRKAGGAKKQAVKSKSDTDLVRAQKKLQATVKAGEPTKKQATAKISAIKKEGAKKSQDSDRTMAHLMKIKKELGERVEAGKISKEDAAKRFKGAEKAIKERMATDRRQRGPKRITREDYARAEADLRKLAAKGKISKEDMLARLNGMRKIMAGHSERGAGKAVDWEGIKKQIEGAVKSGKMTREQADAKYKGIKEQMAGRGKRDSKRIGREDIGRAAGEIHKAIAEGKMTKEQGRAKLAAMRKMMGAKSEGAVKKGAVGKVSREDVSKRGVDWEGIKKQIEGAVKSGKMTREQADAKYKDIRERLGQRVKKKDAKDNGDG